MPGCRSPGVLVFYLRPMTHRQYGMTWSVDFCLKTPNSPHTLISRTALRVSASSAPVASTAACSLAPRTNHRSETWCARCSESGASAAPVRRIVYAGPTADAAPEDGPLICACFGVRLSAIRETIAADDAVNVADIGRTLRAGTNCGSCVPEVKGIIKRFARVPYDA